jgi:HlyD family secretion protein
MSKIDKSNNIASTKAGLRPLERLNKASNNVKFLAFFKKSVQITDRFIEFIFSRKSKKYQTDEVVEMARSPIIFGSWVMLITFGLMGSWALFAPLNSASIASGTIVVASKTKTIQHLEGGIIENIYVKEGDSVREGEPLIKLSETRAKSSFSALDSQLNSLQATEDRLIAERDSLEEIKFDDNLLKRSQELEVSKIIDTQKRLFETRKEAMANKKQVYEYKIHQSLAEVDSLEAQLGAARKQLSIVQEQTNTAEKLMEKHHIKRAALLELQKNLAAFRGHVADYEARISTAKQKISVAKVELLDAETTRINEIIRELRETQIHLSDIRERFKSSEDQLNRIMIRAPQTGIIKDLSFHTIGGVIPPGAKIAEIVPSADRLIIEARVQVQDIDRIMVGQKAKIRVAAYKSRVVPMLKGIVTHISPDSFEDPRGGMQQPYYLAKIEIDTKQYSKNDKLKDLQLYPGMKASVLIITGTKTFARYLIDPFIDTIRKSFKER